MSSDDSVYYDPYKVEITLDPYQVYRRLREEAPLYYNEPHDFFTSGCSACIFRPDITAERVSG